MTKAVCTTPNKANKVADAVTTHKNGSPSGREKDAPKSGFGFNEEFVSEAERDAIMGHSAIDRQTTPAADGRDRNILTGRFISNRSSETDASKQARIGSNNLSSASTSLERLYTQIPATFPLFSELALELRTDIWVKSLPEPQYIYLHPDFKQNSKIVFETHGHCGYPWGTSTDESDDEDNITYEIRLIRQPQPYLLSQQIDILALLRTCTESRIVAMAAYNVQLPMSLGRTWRMDGSRDTLIPTSIKNEFRRPLHRTTYKSTWNALIKDVKHLALFCDVIDNWTEDDQAWRDMRRELLHLKSCGEIQKIPFERKSAPVWPPIAQIFKDTRREETPDFNPPTLIALATHSGEEYDDDPVLYGGADETSEEEESEDYGGVEYEEGIDVKM
ncbi:hypothetical protein BKA64DRAFT_720820 [Cadophora sp. MPI-SDFR-AT-0126]|nr:hypothetical protein BKA64DRAFT_720820 [Leotiomycetes sp. MPI-SDFR-AT-0126]